MTNDPATDALTRVDWPVRTARLLLRPARPADADAVRGYRRLPEVNRWLAAAPQDHEWTDYFERNLGNQLVIELDGKIIGDLVIKIENAWAQREVADRAEACQAELGWTLDPAFGGRGYATEAVQGVITLCFTGLGLRRVTANCFADNEPSWRLMERVGMRRELATQRESLHREYGWLHGYGYALLADEWQASKG